MFLNSKKYKDKVQYLMLTYTNITSAKYTGNLFRKYIQQCPIQKKNGETFGGILNPLSCNIVKQLICILRPVNC